MPLDLPSLAFDLPPSFFSGQSPPVLRRFHQWRASGQTFQNAEPCFLARSPQEETPALGQQTPSSRQKAPQRQEEELAVRSTSWVSAVQSEPNVADAAVAAGSAKCQWFSGLSAFTEPMPASYEDSRPRRRRSRSFSRSASASPVPMDMAQTRTAQTEPQTAVSFDHLQAVRGVTLIQRNEYPLKHLSRDKVRRRARSSREEEDDEEGSVCFCTFPDSVERDEAASQGEEVKRCDDVSCLNFATYVECNEYCPAGQFCRNQRLQHPELFPTLEPFKTENKGYGVRTQQEIAQLSIVGEYVGEIIDQKELAWRLKSVPRHELNFYYLLLAPGVYIDARNKGSFTRFVNHSCEPNCKTEKWTVKGETRIAVIALRDIAIGEELTFDYQWKALGSRQIKCFCGSANCKGVIGTESDASLKEKAGYFRDPEKGDIGEALVGRRVRVFLSPDEKSEYDVMLIKRYDAEQDRYEVDDLLEPTGYMTNEDEDEDAEEEVREKQFVMLKENGWQLYCSAKEDKAAAVFAIPKKRQLSGASAPSSVNGSREPSPKPTGDTTSLSSGETPSPQSTIAHAAAGLFAGRDPGVTKRNQFGELLDRDGFVVSSKLLVKGLPKKFDERTLRNLFVDRRRPQAPNALVSLDVFSFEDGSSWALVELTDSTVASFLRRTLDRRPLNGSMLRVYQAGHKELDTFQHQKGKAEEKRRRMREVSSSSATQSLDGWDPRHPSEMGTAGDEPARREAYCYGRKLNWLVTEEQAKDLPAQQGARISAQLEESLRLKYVKNVLRIAKSLHLDREDATSAIIALNRYFTFHAMAMNAEILAAAMLHLFLKAHARKVRWPSFVREVYSAKYGATAAQGLTEKSPELGVLKRHLIEAEGELLEGLRYDLTGEDPYALLDLLTTGKSRKKLVGVTDSSSSSSSSSSSNSSAPTAQQLPSFLSSLPPAEVQKEAKHLVAETLGLSIWTLTSVECVVLSVVYVSAAVMEVLKPNASPSATVPDFLPQLDLQANRMEAEQLLNCSLAICTRLKERWTRLEKHAKSAKQQKQANPSQPNVLDLEQFSISHDKHNVDISERIAQLLKEWINVPKPSSSSAFASSSADSSTVSSATHTARSTGTYLNGKSYVTLAMLGSQTRPRLADGARIDPEETTNMVSAISAFPKKSSVSRNATSVSSSGTSASRVHTNEITNVEAIRKRGFLGVISDDTGLDLGGKPVYLQLWPYREQEAFFTPTQGINEVCLRELSPALTLPSLLPDRFMNLYGIVFPEEKERKTGTPTSIASGKSDGTKDVDMLDVLAVGIDDDSVDSVDRLDPKKHYLAFEKPLHMLSGIFEARISLSPLLRKKAIFDMLQSLAAVHDQGYVHRFVAPSHLLVFQHGVKLGGYHAMRKTSSVKSKESETGGGLSASSTSAYEMSDSERKEHCYGTWLYGTAPEVLLGETRYTWRADIWSAGCVALALLLEKMPFLQGQSVKVQLDLIFRLCGTPSSSWQGALQLPLYNSFKPKHEFKMRLRKTLLEQRSKFPDFPEDAVEVLEAMLQLDPAKRSPVKKLLDMSFFDSVRREDRAVDFSTLPATFPVQKKKLAQHLLKSKAKKRRLIGSTGSGSASSSHHRSLSKDGSTSRSRSASGHHRKRTSSSMHEGSEADSRSSRRRSRGDEHKTHRDSRSSSSSRRDSARGSSSTREQDVEMRGADEDVPLPASFHLSVSSMTETSSSSYSNLGVNDDRRPREKRAKLGWGMGLNSASQNSTQDTQETLAGSPTTSG